MPCGVFGPARDVVCTGCDWKGPGGWLAYVHEQKNPGHTCVIPETNKEGK